MNKETLKKAKKVLASLECAEKTLSDMREALYRYTTIDEDTSKPLTSIQKSELVVWGSGKILESYADEEHFPLNSELTIIIARVIVDYLEKRTDELRKEFDNL